MQLTRALPFLASSALGLFVGCNGGGGGDCPVGTVFCGCLAGVCQVGLVCDGMFCVPDSNTTLDTSGPGDGDPGDGDGTPGDGDGTPGDGDGTPGDGDGTPGDGDGTPGDGDGTPGPTIDVNGAVVDLYIQSSIAGADVSVRGMPGFETVSDPDGEFWIPGLPGNTEVFFLAGGNEGQFWSSVYPADLPNTNITDLVIPQISNQLLAAQIDTLQQQDPNIVLDDSKAMIVVRLLQPAAAGATVTMNPPPANGTSYAADANNSLVLDSDLIDSSLLPLWVAFNLTPDNVGGAYDITVDHPQRTCTVMHPVFPTLASHITFVDVDCPP